MALVEITPQEYDVDIDIVYATDRNFTGAPIYSRPAC
jgi:D-alanyl-D-alanine dipeptidase